MKAPFSRSVGSLCIALVYAFGLTSAPLPSSPPSLSLVVDIAPPTSPTGPKSQQLLFQFMLVPVMRQMSETDWYLRDSDLPPTQNVLYPHSLLTRTTPPQKYDQEPVHKPPWTELLV